MAKITIQDVEHMDAKNQKTNIIINEILFWKQNKMLPEQYCDYLTGSL